MNMDIILYIILGQITGIPIRVFATWNSPGTCLELCDLEFTWDPNSDFCDLEFEFRVAKPTSRPQFP